MIAAALSENHGLALRHFEAGRDRLENKGITALAQVFGGMGSLEEIHVPQNGIKDDGMAALLHNLQGARGGHLRVLRINDNWLKTKAAEELLALLVNGERLELLNISDLNMGQETVLVALRALAASKCVLGTFQCNYNEVGNREAASECLRILLEQLGTRERGGRRLTECDFIGNCSSVSLAKEFTAKFAEKKIALRLADEDAEEESDAESEEGEDLD